MPEYRDDAPHLWVSRPLDQHGGLPADDDCEAICTVCHSRVTVGPDGGEFGHGYGCTHRADHLPNHQSRGHHLSDHVCPTCGRGDFDTRRALSSHHAAAHGDTLRKTQTCVRCDEEYELRRPGKDQQYCSPECAARGRRDRVEIECAGCGDTVEVTPSEADRGKRYCSDECRYDDHRDRVTVTCPECGEDFETIPSLAGRDGRKYCSKACAGRVGGRTAQERQSASGGVAGD